MVARGGAEVVHTRRGVALVPVLAVARISGLVSDLKVARTVTVGHPRIDDAVHIVVRDGTTAEALVAGYVAPRGDAKRTMKQVSQTPLFER
jgi:hypothetical protein